MKVAHSGFVALAMLLSACTQADEANHASASRPEGTEIAIFAGGCFWCVEADFEKLDGVVEAISGYTGGHVDKPTYHQVGNGGTGHTEAVRVVYDPQKVSYRKLLDYFWRHIDPTVKDKQFCDVGDQYRSAIFTLNPEQQALATESRDALLKSGRFRHVYTEIAPAKKFYEAEGYHQDYYKKNPIRYRYYRHGCGRDARIAEVWGSR